MPQAYVQHAPGGPLPFWIGYNLVSIVVLRRRGLGNVV
ncbi:hypothetical protein PMI08_04659 [Brevibacillus sp. CF112]|nr:hypothetical protein PMI08_04659 [Brevibacillus sp. CF112]